MFHTPQLYLRVRYPLRFFVCHVHPVIQQYENVCNHCSRYVEIRWCLMPQLSSEIEVSISLVFLTHYTIVRIKNCLKSTSAIKVATMKNTDDFHYTIKGSHHVQPPNQHSSLSAKMNGTQRRTLVSP